MLAGDQEVLESRVLVEKGLFQGILRKPAQEFGVDFCKGQLGSNSCTVPHESGTHSGFRV